MKKQALSVLFLSLLASPVFAQKGNEVNHFSMDTLSWEKKAEKSNKPKLEVVVQMNERPGNVAVSPMGVVFSTIHPLGNPSQQLVKLNTNQTYEAFPNSTWQKKQGQSASATTFDTPLGVQVDSQNRVWVIDMGLNYGKTRLFAFDAKTGKKVFENVFSERVAPKGSFIQDLAIDEQNGFVYLADISNPGILILNLKNNQVRRLKSNPSFQSENVDMVIDGKVINFGGKPARVAVNPLTLSQDKNTLYFGAMNGKTWYRLDAKLLRNNASDEDIIHSIQIESPKPISDGVATDSNGDHYFTNLNDKGIDKWHAEMRTYEPVIRDTRLDWVDNVSLGPDGFLYVAVNQLYKTPAFTGSTDEGKAPYYIYRLKVKN